MQQHRLLIRFLSDWHISSGLGDGYRADAVLVRDQNGFFYIPGRAVKGALREGARRLGLCRGDLRHAERFFWGTRHNDVDTNESGTIRVSSAHLPDDLQSTLIDLEPSDRERLINDLTIVRSQTALTDTGVAKASSLRSIECGMIGLELEASLHIQTIPEIDEAWIEDYCIAVCAAVKSIGGNRSRGLGRCRIRLAGREKKPVLPAEQPFLTHLGGTA